MRDRPCIAAFRPPDDRARAAAELIEVAGGTPLIDPMIEPEPTGVLPRSDADVTILTSVTAATLPGLEDWSPGEGRIAAIGPKTAEALEERGITVDCIPETYTSDGMVSALADDVDGARVELARSDHGSDALPRGLEDAGAYVHETVLYRLIRPDEAGRSVEAVIDGDVDALAFSSSLTVVNFLACAEDLSLSDALGTALDTIAVGVIGPPTAQTASKAGIEVDVVASEATFDTLVHELMATIEERTQSA